MKPQVRWAIVLIAGLVLLVLPSAIRLLQPQTRNAGTYVAPTNAPAVNAATPIPTHTPVALPSPAATLLASAAQPLRGAVIVDLAHYSQIDRNRFQPLAAALSQYGLDLRFWLPTTATADIKDVAKFPDLSADLAKQLDGASALVVVSPYFLYTPNEIAVVKKFVSDGGQLLVISDPDIESDAARDTNQLASAFNIVFNEDYLYDTVENDENYTYFFQGDFYDRAQELAGSKIAFYGGRSISGAIVPQVRSNLTTLSSQRIGLTGFNTVVIGGLSADASFGRVLGMSDFDVLTDPFVARHDNRKLLDFVARFLAAAKRSNTIVDFPAFLSPDVGLAIDSAAPLGATALTRAAALQQMIENSGRTLELTAGATWRDVEQSAGQDLIYVTDYRTAAKETPLLADLGITLTEEIITPTVAAAPATVAPAASAATATAVATAAGSPSSTPITATVPAPVPSLTPEAPASATPQPVIPPKTPAATLTELPVTPSLTATPEAPAPITTTLNALVTLLQSQGVTATGEPAAGSTAMPVTSALTATTQVTTSAAVTGSTSAPGVTPAGTPTPAPTPQITLYLERKDGTRLIAAETQLFVRRTDPSGRNVLAVLGADEQSIGAAVTRLLNRDFAGCLSQGEVLLCPYAAGSAPSAAGGSSANAAPTPASTAAATPAGAPAGAPTGVPTPKPSASPAPTKAAHAILIVDDNAQAAEGEKSEAAIYLTVLTAAGYDVNLWVTSAQGMPKTEDLAGYGWVVWSDATYATSGIDGDALRVVSGYINEGGHLTISSRMPFFGVGAGAPAPIKDLVVTEDLPMLVANLPKTIALATETPPLNPLQDTENPDANARTAMQRGPGSGAAGVPVLMLLSDQNAAEPKGALLMLFAMSMGWLPNDASTQLIQNMAQVMLAG